MERRERKGSRGKGTRRWRGEQGEEKKVGRKRWRVLVIFRVSMLANLMIYVKTRSSTKRALPPRSLVRHIVLNAKHKPTVQYRDNNSMMQCSQHRLTHPSRHTTEHTTGFHPSNWHEMGSVDATCCLFPFYRSSSTHNFTGGSMADSTKICVKSLTIDVHVHQTSLMISDIYRIKYNQSDFLLVTHRFYT